MIKWDKYLRVEMRLIFTCINHCSEENDLVQLYFISAQHTYYETMPIIPYAIYAMKNATISPVLLYALW